MSKLLLAITEILEKNFDKIITKSIESLLGRSASTEILLSLLLRKTPLPLGHESTLGENHLPPSSTYGKTIPKVYGTGKVDGSVIWSLPIRYSRQKVVSTSGKGGKRKEKTSTSCSVTLAIAICSGPINRLSKIWANGKPVALDELRYRLYLGTENQEPDRKILESEEHAPAYRGLAYLVVEELPLQSYNDTIPHFSFEVTAYTGKSLRNHVTQKILEIHTVGFGAWAYDTNIQTRIPITTVNGKEIPFGEATKINGKGKSSYAIQGLDQLQSTLPNVQWIAVSVHWFASVPDIKHCILKPGTVRNAGFRMASDSWQVANYTAATACEISATSLDTWPGETPSDTSLNRYIEKLKLENYKVMLVLKIVIIDDYDNKLTYSENDANVISKFFAEQYQPFVEHYCNLAKPHVDAFVIASGLSKLTRIKSEKSEVFPAVEELIKVAIYAKISLGQNIVITYAADHDEYHSHNGVYNMDPLWTSYGIDVVGINAYFPLCSPAQTSCRLSADDVANLWQNGGQSRLHDSPAPHQDSRFSWQDIGYWWREYHTMGVSDRTTSWKPRMKKIWFIEYGFPSIKDCLIGATPYTRHTSSINNTADFAAQKIAISGTIQAWRSSAMVEKMFLFAWSITPYNKNTKMLRNWQEGFTINNKISSISLSSILYDILQGITLNLKVDANLASSVYGFVITKPRSVWDIVQELRKIYLLCIRENVGSISFSDAPTLIPLAIPAEDMLMQEYVVANQTNSLQDGFALLYKNLHFDYQLRLAGYPSTRNHIENSNTMHTSLVIDDQQAEEIMDRIQEDLSRPICTYMIALPLKYLQLRVGDIVKLKQDILVRITSIKINNERVIITGNSSIRYTKRVPNTKGNDTN
ncbi:hypothetical protein ANPL_03105 [Anaplasma platys]|uniref:GTA TIM-barrel-like domain-containing protein n=1 Tax=Anaplasma platys TaxID=949 RepID=A0A858PYL5_9RICK|nr:glycoside hydrolase TIM-barrel-like domain-containing protein [Anaplasma platys]QJC27691.1 hypothetical protein ANPL_03105 [Anaplasma platys]